MNIFEFARNQETQAEKNYRSLAEGTITIGLKNIFTRLADAEKRHFEIIQKMEKAEKFEIITSDILDYAQEAINKMKSGKEKFKTVTSQIGIYKAAQAQEAEAERFYREYSEKSTDEHQRIVILGLAKEEHQHFTVLENIIDFINFPANHPEDAEFNASKE
ncbi:MAG: ferritin family protein [Candidatus Riflebacteria bacterium]|nr:ferritin family protein [Candidatus Riflebacteria bacterium]